jgi:hypothetical protein
MGLVGHIGPSTLKPLSAKNDPSSGKRWGDKRTKDAGTVRASFGPSSAHYFLLGALKSGIKPVSDLRPLSPLISVLRTP